MIPDEQMMSRALQDFGEARRQAAMSEIISRVKGSKASLLSFDEVNEMLKRGALRGRLHRGAMADAFGGSGRGR